MKVLIFGGNSFTAQHFSWRTKYSCKFLSRSDFSYPMDSDEVLGQITEILERFEPDVLVNLISISATSIESPFEYLTSNFQICKNLLECCAKSKINLRKFIQASSAHVYGNAESLKISEGAAIRPASLYAKSKFMSELIAEFYNEEFPILITRPFNYTGVGQNERNFFIPKLVSAVINKAPVLTLGELDVIRDFSDVRDIDRYYDALINLQDFKGVVNLCSGKGYRLKDIVKLVQEISGFRFEIESFKNPPKNSPSKMQIGCNKKLLELTGIEPIYPIEDTITWMLNK